ncbi:WD40 repeat domain-containing protein [Nonomuraea sp. GTA35]|uniref:WD40 repeat domain-containing protein n=1 Tax=Nonomuraea sp. GTA35 TaxID=1676746 RepID=UPI0035C24BC7
MLIALALVGEEVPPTLFDAPPKRLPETLDGSHVTAIGFTRDSRIAVGTETGRIEIREHDGSPTVAGGRQLDLSSIVALAFSSDGKYVAAATLRSVYIVDLFRLQTIIKVNPFDADDYLAGINSIALNSHATHLAVGDLNVTVYDIRSRSRIAVLSSTPFGEYGERGEYKSLSFTDEFLYASDVFGTDVWASWTWKLASSFQCSCFHELKWSPDQRWASFGTADGHVLLWDGASKRPTKDVTAAIAPGVYTGDTAVSNDASMLFAGLSTGEVLAWTHGGDLPAGRVRVGTRPLLWLRLSPDGRQVIAGEESDEFIDAARAYRHDLWMVAVRR